MALATKESLVAQAQRMTFGRCYDAAVPAWNPEAMEVIATQYKGPHARDVCGIAASLALGEPFGPDEDAKPDGGTRERIPEHPVDPRGPAPAVIENSLATS